LFCKTSNMKHIFISAFIIGFGLSVAYNQVPESDSLALVALYNSTNGDNWTENTNWLQPGQPVSTWYGIVINDNRVAQIDLVRNNLTGTLPDEIGDLDSLKVLELYVNQISGGIPATIGNLAGLTWLSLRGNQLIGSIPSEIGNLINLEHLYLFENQLEGPIPAEIGNLVNLKYLLLQNNMLIGPIPDEICNLTGLSHLSLDYNQLSDSIPDCIGNITGLTELRLGNNKLTGSIPEGIGNLTNLGYLDLSNNQLMGSIPTEIGNLTKLGWLGLARNQLTGPIPPEIGELAHITYLALTRNRLTGPIPPELCNLPILHTLFLYGNQLDGSIPAEIGNLRELRFLYLRSNKLSGEIPAEIGNLDSLEILSLENNEFAGSIPSAIGNLKKLRELTLMNNQISGNIPHEISGLTQLSLIDLTNNKLEGPVPEGIRDLPVLTTLSLQDNYFNFHDLEPLTGLAIESFIYHPQGPVPLANHQVNSISGSDLEIDITGLTHTDCYALGNQYRWWKGESSITSYSDSPVLSFSGVGVTDEGRYYCTMINSGFPDLTLITDTISLVIDGPVDLLLMPDTVTENAVPGTLVGILTAEDPDQESGHTFAFAAGDGLNDVDNDSFLIHSDSVFILTTPDYEKRQEYSIYVRATDDDSKTFEKALVIRVQDVQESGPTGMNMPDAMKFTAKVYPNPASEYVTLEYEPDEAGNLSASLFDLHGRLLQSFISQMPMPAGRHQLHFILDRSMHAGNYMLLIRDNSGIQSIPLIKYDQ